jgi:hypothetical protein
LFQHGGTYFPHVGLIPTTRRWSITGMANNKAPRGKKMHNLETAFDPVAAALKQLHQAVTNEELPQDFLRLLEDIDAKIAVAKSSSKRVQ